MSDRLEDLEGVLSELSPRPPRLSRDRLMYESGWAAAVGATTIGRFSLRAWKISTAVSTLTALCLAIAFFGRTPPSMTTLNVPEIETAPRPAESLANDQSRALNPEDSPPIRELTSPAMRNRVLASWEDHRRESPTQGPVGNSSPTYRELRDQLLPADSPGG